MYALCLLVRNAYAGAVGNAKRRNRFYTINII